MIQEDQQQNKRRCPACGSDAFREAGQKNGILLLSCRNCATLYATDCPVTSSTQHYDEYYDEHNLTVPDFIHQQLRGIVTQFAPFRQTNRLLDVGCGSGVLLEAARDAGWEAEGVEVSRPAVEHIRERGFKVFHGELSEARYPDGYFDVVTATELLEHVPDPQALVAEVTRILRRGGLFWATTPHSKGMSGRMLGTKWSIVSPPEHLHLFSLRGMRNLLASSGFSRPRIVTHGVNPFEILKAIRNRGQKTEDSAVSGNERVESSYQLNEKLTKNQFNKALKTTLNAGLRLTRMGDSLKIWAVK